MYLQPEAFLWAAAVLSKQMPITINLTDFPAGSKKWGILGGKDADLESELNSNLDVAYHFYVGIYKQFSFTCLTKR